MPGTWTSTLKAFGLPPATSPGTAEPSGVPPASRSPRNRSTRATPDPDVASGSYAVPEMTSPPAIKLLAGPGLLSERTGHAAALVVVAPVVIEPVVIADGVIPMDGAVPIAGA